MSYWSPRESKPAEKTVHHPSRVISEVLPRANCVLLACPGPKLALGRTSEMNREGWCTVFSAGLDSLGGQYGTPFPPEIPKIAKKCPKGGYPPLTNFSVRYHLSRPCCRRFSKKSAEIPPIWTILRGGGFRTFFRKSATAWSGKVIPSQNRVCRRGSLYNPL